MDDKPYLIKGGLASDDRGVVRFVNGFDFAGVRRFYVLENWQAGFVRAWHGHLREAKWVTVVRGAALVCAVPITLGVDNAPMLCTMGVEKFLLSEHQPAVLCIPPGFANGSMALLEWTQVMHFSDMTMEETAGDDLRWPWDAIPGVWEVQQR